MKTHSWTLAILALLIICNLPIGLGLALEYEREAIASGQCWRLLTGNLVHWSLEHFLLDVLVYLILGVMYEEHLGRRLPLLVLGIMAGVGVVLFVFEPNLQLYRGFSGVDSGLFAAALGIELAQWRDNPRRMLLIVPAAAIFAVKIAFECCTGAMFFGTESLGDLGAPVPLAHAAGAVVGLGWLVARWLARRASKGLPNPCLRGGLTSAAG